MTTNNPVKTWAGQVRAPFLLLSVVLVLIGGAVAYSDGVVDWLRVGLCMIGVVLAHISVNLFNELSDHKTGIDDHTMRTPFSGGSGSLQGGLTTRRAVLAALALIVSAFYVPLRQIGSAVVRRMAAPAIEPTQALRHYSQRIAAIIDLDEIVQAAMQTLVSVLRARPWCLPFPHCCCFCMQKRAWPCSALPVFWATVFPMHGSWPWGL